MSVSGPAAPSTSPASTAITALRAAGESGDAGAVAELLAPDVVFHSPFTARLRFEGKEEVAALHRDIFAVLEDIDTTEPLALGDTRSFTFRGRVRGVELEAMVLVRCNDRDRSLITSSSSARSRASRHSSRRSRRGYRCGVADACGARSWRPSPGHSPSRCAPPTAWRQDSCRWS